MIENIFYASYQWSIDVSSRIKEYVYTCNNKKLDLFEL